MINLSRFIKRFWKIILVALMATAALCIVFDAFLWEPETFEVNAHTVYLKNWHKEHNGMRVAVLSDIHQLNTPHDYARLDRIIQATNDQKPDLILLLGDFLGGTMDWKRMNAQPRQIASCLKKLSAKHGVYAVLGNHDWWLDGQGIRDALLAVGIRVLENQVETLLIESKPLNIIGLPDAGTRQHLFDRDALPDESIPALVMAHDPDSFSNLDLPYELTLAGHTHGGQVQLPVMGAVTSYSPLLSAYVEGMYEKSGRRLFVTRGLGTSLMKVRFRCLPEIVILTLYRQPEQ